MSPANPESNPFPASEFDDWAHRYDQEVTGERFPFTGYDRVLAEIVRLADVKPGMSVLDLGTGTGNVAERLVKLGCTLWCTDFSVEMLERAWAKLPAAHFFLHDLREPFPPPLQRRFDRIVSAYVFHHFELPEKAEIAARLVQDHLEPGGILVIADLSFPAWKDLEAVRREAGALWDDEPYWIAAEALPVLREIDPVAEYRQISNCAGVYRLAK